MNLLLDTHALLWWLTDGRGLSKPQRTALDLVETRGETIWLSSITLWEIAKLDALGRIRTHQAVDDLLAELEAHPRLRIAPLSARVALESTRLGPRFHRDPADQIIAATARVHGLRLVTADRRIRDSGVVPTI